jgi:hypothetical protein
LEDQSMYSRLIWEAETEEEIKVEELEKVQVALEALTRKTSRDLKRAAIALATSVTTGVLAIWLGIRGIKKIAKSVHDIDDISESEALKMAEIFAKTVTTSLGMGTISNVSFLVFIVFMIKYFADKSALKTLEAATLTEGYIHESWLLVEAETKDDKKKIFEKIKKFFANKKGAASKLGKTAKTFFNSKTGKILGGASILALAVLALLIVKKNVAPEKSMGEFIIDLIKKIKSHPWSLGVALTVIGILGIIYIIIKRKKKPSNGSGRNYEDDINDFTGFAKPE